MTLDLDLTPFNPEGYEFNKVLSKDNQKEMLLQIISEVSDMLNTNEDMKDIIFHIDTVAGVDVDAEAVYALAYAYNFMNSIK